MRTWIYLILALIISSTANAAVNMRNGSFTESWIDFIQPKEGFDMRIERFYSSRSLFVGMFGFGWCSSLETNLNITSDGIINLTECGGGLEATYYPENFDLLSKKKTINAIVKHLVKTKKLNTEAAGNLAKQLSVNTKLRFEYANQLHLVDTKKLKHEKNVFISKSKGIEQIAFNGSTYTRRRYDGYTEKFDKSGKLIQIVNSAGFWMKITYKGTQVAYLVDQKGRRINFSYSPNGQLNKIYNGQGLVTSYKFEGENLVAIKNMWDKTYTYSYDQNHNLTAIAFPDGTSMRMTYNLSNDWIKSYTNRIGCREDFDFILSKNDPKNHYWSTFARKCKNGPSVSGRHEFWYKTYGFSKDKYLHRAKELRGADYRDMFLHPYLGRPTSIRENQTYSGFAYYLNGLLNKEENKLYGEKRDILKWVKSDYKYDFKRFLMTQSTDSHLNKLGKPIKREKTQFRYDKKGTLVRAQQGKNTFVTISYNQAGQFTQLQNHKKESVTLAYDDGAAKPTTIQHSRLGSVQIAYDSEGEIDSVSSKDKRTVASSVIQGFLDMIEFLGPMGSVLKI